jgi:hypothetical protein
LVQVTCPFSHVGAVVGDVVDAVGAMVGALVVGAPVGDAVGAVGTMVGGLVGNAVGAVGAMVGGLVLWVRGGRGGHAETWLATL